MYVITGTSDGDTRYDIICTISCSRVDSVPPKLHRLDRQKNTRFDHFQKTSLRINKARVCEHAACVDVRTVHMYPD